MDFSKIRIVGLDLDETVFTSDKRITERTQKAITEAIRAGVHVLPATGRPVNGIPVSFAGIKGVRYLLGCNGAIVYDQEEKRFLVDDCMAPSTAITVADWFQAECDCIVEAYVGGEPYAEKDKLLRADYYFPNPYIRSYVLETRTPVDNMHDFLASRPEGAEKLNLSFATVEAKEDARIRSRVLEGVQIVQGLPTNLEISRADVDKGSGLLKLAKVLGYSQENVLACGDSGNDLAMIQKAGIGCAMKNAMEICKKSADLILPYTNDEEGCAWLLEQITAAVTSK